MLHAHVVQNKSSLTERRLLHMDEVDNQHSFKMANCQVFALSSIPLCSRVKLRTNQPVESIIVLSGSFQYPLNLESNYFCLSKWGQSQNKWISILCSLFVCWSFVPWQQLGSYQNGHRLATEHALMTNLQDCPNRKSGCLHHDVISHSVTLSCPCPIPVIPSTRLGCNTYIL